MSPANTAEEAAFFDAVRKADIQRLAPALRANPDVVQAIDHSEFGGTALNLAVGRGYESIVEMLLASGANPNQLSAWPAGPWNALQSALSCGNDAIAATLVARGASLGAHELAGLGRAEELQALLETAPGEIHASGGDGCTPLHFAATPECVDVLLGAGANIEARDIDHFSTPLHYLAKLRKAAARRLIERGARHDLFTAIACEAGELVEDYIATTPNWQKLRIDQDTFPSPSEGTTAGASNVLFFMLGGNATPLHAAVKARSFEMIDLLIRHGMEPDIRGDYDDCTPMHMAAWWDDVESAKRLSALGASLDLESGAIHHNTPLGWAIVGGSPNIAHWLIQQGVEIRSYFADEAVSARNLDFMGWRPGTSHRNYQLVADLILAQS